MKKRDGEASIEFISRGILWAAVSLLELLWEYVLTPIWGWFWGMVGRRVEGVVKIVLSVVVFAASAAFFAVYWYTDFDLGNTIELFKALFA